MPILRIYQNITVLRGSRTNKTPVLRILDPELIAPPTLSALELRHNAQHFRTGKNRSTLNLTYDDKVIFDFLPPRFMDVWHESLQNVHKHFRCCICKHDLSVEGSLHCWWQKNYGVSDLQLWPVESETDFFLSFWDASLARFVGHNI